MRILKDAGKQCPVLAFVVLSGNWIEWRGYAQTVFQSATGLQEAGNKGDRFYYG